MLDDLQHVWRIWRRQAQKQDISKEYRKLQAKARKEKEEEEINRLIHEEMWETDLINDEILQLQSRYLLNKAEKYLLPKPEFKSQDGAWEQSEITGKWRLNQPALSELKTVVRNEQKQLRDRWQSWLTSLSVFIGALTGLAGVLIGLLSVWPNSN